MAVVRVDVDRPFEQEGLIQTVQLLANGFLPALDLSDSLCRIGLQFPPSVHHAVLDEAHEASCWLKARELLDEQLLEFGLADVHRATAATTVVVRVVVAASLRPARRQRLPAGLAANVPTQREVGIVAFARPRDFETTVEDRLHAEEDLLADKRFEVTSSRNPKVPDVDLRDVGAVAEHGVERLRRHG